MAEARAAAPFITTQPVHRTVVAGSNHTFEVIAGGSPVLAYQWFRDGFQLAAQTNASLPLVSIQTGDAGSYSVVITNAEGSVTSALARLTVRLPGEPLYPTPHAGWSYIYQGSDISSSLTAALDGTWNHEGDGWSGDGRGSGNGLLGGVSTTSGIATIEDAVASGTGFNNRRFYFTHNLAQETAVTNAGTLLNDGVTLTFRARLTPPTDPLIEITNAPNGHLNNSDGRGAFGIRQSGAGGHLIGFSLGQAVEDTTAAGTFNLGAAGLHMNNLNGNARTNNVDPGEGGTTNLLALDPAAFHEFWITIQDNGADPGTHRVTIYKDGNLTPATYNITSGTGFDGPATNYLALGMSSTGQRGSLDIDYFGYKAGAFPPSAFNQPVAITRQPAAQFATVGQYAAFSADHTGTPPYGYQWYRNGSPISGGTNATLVLGPVTPADDGAAFTLTVTNEFNSVTTAAALLSLLGTPVITTQPQSQIITNGDSLILAVAANSPVTPAYQWRVDGNSISNQTNALLQITVATLSNSGTYDVTITNPSGSVTSAPALVTIIGLDYGDAPVTYPTLRTANGARHRVLPGIHLGAGVDVDLDATPAAQADGDDLGGTDDEDGVTLQTPLHPGQTATLQITASTNALLHAWADWNQNGTWTDPGEQILANVPLTTGNNTLNISVPGSALGGTAIARFRFSTAADLAPAGPAPDGEVEDHLLTVTPLADLRLTQTAAPDPVALNTPLTLATIITNAGPSTATAITLTNPLPVGAIFQSATPSQGSCFQIADQIRCDLGTLAAGATAQIQLTIIPGATGPHTNTVTVAATNILDPAPANNTATTTFTALAPPAITVPPADRVTTNGAVAQLTVTATGGMPLNYQWRFNGTNVTALNIPGSGFGVQTSGSNSVLTITNATLAVAGTFTVTITNPVGTVTSPAATLTVLLPPAIITPPQSATNLAGSSVTLQAAVSGTAPLNHTWRLNGTNVATLNVPNSSFIFETSGTNSVLTIANVTTPVAGLYTLTITNAAGTASSPAATLTVIEMDYGDAPASYGTTLAANGARHRILPGVRLGAGNDFEPDGQPDPQAAGDDIGTADDEDGVTFNTPLRTGQNATLTITASTNGQLNAWVDWNRNGNWSDPGEQIFTNRALAAGANNLTLPVPAGASAGDTYARFRFNTTGGLGPTGEAANGEVEDHPVTVELAADLLITRASQLNPVAVGSNQIYSFTISNAGPATATGVSFADILPAGVNYLSATTSQGGCLHSAGTVACSIGTLAPSLAVTITITGICTAEGTLLNTVTLGGNQVDVTPANNSTAQSAAALLLPTILTQPQNQTVTSGGAAGFEVVAGGTALRYQWRLAGTNLPGATNAALAIAAALPANEGPYTVRVNNDLGAVTSAVATLTVLVPINITTQPQSQTVLAGANVTLNVAHTGSAPVTYQWERDGVDLPGQTAASLAFTGITTSETGTYRVRITNPLGTVTSADAILTILARPAFTLSPASSTNAAGTTITLNALAAGTGPIAYQWYFNRTNALAGQTNTTLTLTNAPTSRTGEYTAVATNTAGAGTSAVALVVIYEMDFGDAPDTYATTFAFNGARHRVLPGIRLGALLDFETNGLPNATAAGDDTNATDDEDGVNFPATVLLGQTAPLTVVATTNGFLDAWIDYNGNGTWADAGEQILASRPLLAGTNTVPVAISASAPAGTRFARFRFSSTGGLAFDGFAPDGEVEDHRVTLSPAVDIVVGITDSIDPVPLGSNVTYTISVTNRGPSTAGLVWVTNALPGALTFVSAVPQGSGFCSHNAGIIHCLMDDFPKDAGATITLVARATAIGAVTNRAWSFAIAGAPEASPADNTNAQTTVIVAAPLLARNPAPLVVNDATPGAPGLGVPYPSTITVSGLTSALYKVTATLSNMSQNFSKDFDILLVGPGGQKVILMSDAGSSGLNATTLVFDDAAPDFLPGAGVITSGRYRPANYGMAADVFPAPAPAAPFGTALTDFTGTNPNGVWSLYIMDGTVGGIGGIDGGWSLELSVAEPIADLEVRSVNGEVRGSDSALLTSSPTLLTLPDVALGSNLVYALTLTNRGPAVATGVRLTNALPPGVNFLTATASQGTCVNQSGTVLCTIGNLASGAGAGATVTVMPVTAGALTNVVTASGGQLDLVATNNAVALVAVARPATDLAVRQSPSTNLVLLGQPLSYTITVSNGGPNAATAVALADALPLAANFVSASPTQGACSNAAGIVTCALGGLPVGAVAQVVVVVAPNLVGPITNTVSVTSAEIDSNGSNNVSALVLAANVAAELAVVINAEPGTGSVVPVGGNYSCALVVSNAGPASAQGVVAALPLPPGVSLVSATPSQGACGVSNGVVRCGLSVVDAGGTARVDLVLVAGAAGRLSNVVSVSASSVDFVPGNNLAEAVVVALVPPFVVSPPAGGVVTNGGLAVLSVAAGGGGPLDFQWRLNGTNVAALAVPGSGFQVQSSGSNSVLTISNATPAVAGSYDVRVTNGVGAVVSAPAVWRVAVPPVINVELGSGNGELILAEDVASGVVPVVVGDADSAPGSLVVTAGSSDTVLLPLSGIVLGGSGSNRTVQVFPGTNRFGSAVVSLSVRDGDGLMAVASFTVSVSAVNDLPVVSDVPDQSMAEDGVLLVPLVVGDADSAADALVVSVVSSDVSVVSSNGLSFSGSGSNRVLRVSPVADGSGSTILTVTVRDGEGGSASDVFTVSVVPVNDAPTLGALADVVLNEDAGEQVVGLGGISSGATNEAQVLVVSVVSDNPGLVAGAVVDYTSPAAAGVLRFTPAANGSGSAVLRVRVEDGGLSNSVVERAFTVLVNAVNDLPVLPVFGDLSMDEDGATGPIAFTVGDVESAAEGISVTVESSDTVLVPASGLVVSGTGTNRSLMIRPATNQFGVATITVRASDGDGGSVSRSFVLTVREVPKPPVFVVQPQGRTVTNRTLVALSVTTTGRLPIVYEWLLNGTNVGTLAVPGSGFRVQSSGGSSVLTISNATPVVAGLYVARATNGAGVAVSVPAALRVLVEPRITRIRGLAPGAEISFSTVPDLSYTVEFSEPADPPLWSALGAAVPGSGGVMMVTDSSATAPSRLYRVRAE